MYLQPYLNFDGRCEEALEFYRGALGVEVTRLLRFKDSPDQRLLTPGTENKVMHASFRVGKTDVMASDGRCQGKASFQVDWEHRAEGPLYLQISLGECRIHLSEHDEDACPGAVIKLHTDDIEAYVAEIVAKEYPPGVAEQYPGVCEQPWDSLDMLLVDPFGNRLIFTNDRIKRS